MQLHILLGAIVPFISVLIPSVIINLLLKEHALSTFVLVLGGLLLLYGILQGLVSYLNEYNAFAFIKSRGLYFVRNVYLGRAHLDYALLENEEYKKILEDAVEAIETNNNGQEGMFHDFIIFANIASGTDTVCTCKLWTQYIVRPRSASARGFAVCIVFHRQTL